MGNQDRVDCCAVLCWAGRGLQELTAQVPRTCVGRAATREEEGKQTELPFPEIAFGARRRQALVRVEAKEPPWFNELQGQLGIQLCQKHPLNQASESSVW